MMSRRLRLGQDAGVAIRAHAAGVRTRCRRRRRLCGPASARAAWHRVPSHSAMKLTSSPRRNSSITSRPVQRRERRLGFGAIVRDDDAFARRQAVGFENHRESRSGPARGARPSAFSTVTNSAVGIPLCTKKFFAKILLPSSCAASAVGPDDRAGRARGTGPRCLPPAALPARPPSGRRRRFRFGSRRQRHAGRDLRDARIAGRGEDFDALRLRQFPGQRMLAPAAADHQNLHVLATMVTMHDTLRRRGHRRRTRRAARPRGPARAWACGPPWSP